MMTKNLPKSLPKSLHPKKFDKVQIWLGLCVIMVLIMVIIGGLTRLTGSGLSIAEWQLFTGIFPPLSFPEWQNLFSLYQKTPEFQHNNSFMTLKDFKAIFWLEYIHRLWGRALGLMIILPGLWFYIRNDFSPSLKTVLRRNWLLASLMVIIQGIIGWYMVKSGLVKDPFVSPYRLSLHLILALLTFGLLWQTFLQVSRQHPHQLNSFSTPELVSARLHHKIHWGIGAGMLLISLNIIWGAFVAGLDAGMIHNTFPLMSGQWLPEDMWHKTPWYINLFENHSTVQWVHRVLGMSAGVYTIAMCIWLRTKIKSEVKPHDNSAINSYWPLDLLGVLMLTQIILGAVTITLQVPIVPAVWHQINAFLLIAAGILILSKYKRPNSRL